MKSKLLPLAFFLIAIPVLVYVYFLKWRTGTMYGDDLILYKIYSKLNGFTERMNLLVPLGKYRPVNGFVLNLLIETCKKNVWAYYIFNIGVQTANIFIFAAVLNLFLKSPFFSLLFSLIPGLSRFSYYNITQLLYGGVMEGLALIFFLLSLFFILQSILKDEFTSWQKQKGIILSILFANLSMYTHERYIVIFPFLILAILIFPGFKVLTNKQKTVLSLLAVGSMILNFLIKKYVYSIPFFMGTSGTEMTFSLTTVLSFYLDAVLSIIQINSGPEYLIGIRFSSMSHFDKLLITLLIVGLLAVVMTYIKRTWKAFASKGGDKSPIFLFFLLLVLFNLLLVPAISTIRLEQRWLQASLNVFILIVVILVSSLSYKNEFIKGSLFCGFIMLFLWTDYSYLSKGADNIYMNSSEKKAAAFELAVKNNVIHPDSRKLYIWENQKNPNFEQDIWWDLAEGSIFEFYQGKNVKLIFADTIYDRIYPFPFATFRNFDVKTEQILYVDYVHNNTILDLSSEYLLDSLKRFRSKKIDDPALLYYEFYHRAELLLTNDDFSKFSATGFYDYENNIRWTNGNAGIVFNGDYTIKDSLDLELNTYMPPICKNINPKVVLVGDDQKRYESVSSKRNGDKFSYGFYFGQPTTIREVRILSDTITTSPDRRTLSFPFVSLKMKTK